MAANKKPAIENKDYGNVHASYGIVATGKAKSASSLRAVRAIRSRYPNKMNDAAAKRQPSLKAAINELGDVVSESSIWNQSSMGDAVRHVATVSYNKTHKKKKK